MKSKVLALLEILLVYAVMQAISIALRPTGIDRWQRQTLGWSYTRMFVFVGIPALALWLTWREQNIQVGIVKGVQDEQ